MPAILSSIKLKTVVVTAEEISATKDATPSWQDLNNSFILGNEGINFILFIFFKKWIEQISILMIGDKDVASAAPFMPIPIGNINT